MRDCCQGGNHALFFNHISVREAAGVGCKMRNEYKKFKK